MPSKKNFKSFTDAKDFIKSLQFKTGTEFRDFLSSDKKPFDIPFHPEREYKSTGWIDVFDFIGISKQESKLYSKNQKRTNKYLSFHIAKTAINAIELKSQTAWAEYSKTKRPSNIPGNPREVYKAEWISWGDWLGTGRIADQYKAFKSYSEATRFVHKLGLTNQHQWKNYCNSEKFPCDIPKAPYQVYQNNGWVSWGDWLGTNYVANSNREYRDFELAREFVRKLNFKSGKEFKKYCKAKKNPIDIPATPDFIYKNKGWISMADWLGSNIIAPQIKSQNFLSYDESKIFVHKLNFASRTKWDKYSKSGLKPGNIPCDPSGTYKNKGWVSWGDWLGTNKVANQHKEFLTFEECKQFVKKLNFTTWEDWIAYVKSGQKPDNIPSNPAEYYK